MLLHLPGIGLQLTLSQTAFPLLPREDSTEWAETVLKSEPCKIAIACQGSRYGLSLQQSGTTMAQSTCYAEDLTITPPVGGAFAGVMFGLYAFGRGEAVLDPADFTEIRVVGHTHG